MNKSVESDMANLRIKYNPTCCPKYNDIHLLLGQLVSDASSSHFVRSVPPTLASLSANCIAMAKKFSQICDEVTLIDQSMFEDGPCLRFEEWCGLYNDAMSTCIHFFEGKWDTTKNRNNSGRAQLESLVNDLHRKDDAIQKAIDKITGATSSRADTDSLVVVLTRIRMMMPSVIRPLGLIKALDS